jgi:hypothetical protein
VRRGIGQDGALSICGGLYGAAEGLADNQRTGSDVRSVWAVERSPAPLTIKQNVLRYWMNIFWQNDPDAMMVRRRAEDFRGMDLGAGRLTDDEAKVITLNQYLGGGIVCFTEPMHEIQPERLLLLRHVIPSLGAAAVPRDMFWGGRLPAVFDTPVVPKAAGLHPWHTVSYVNWSNQEAAAPFTLDSALLGEYAEQHEYFTVSEFWSGEIWERMPSGGLLTVRGIPPHGCIILRVAPYQERSALVHTDGHFSMGGAEITGWEEHGGRLHVGVDWKWPCPLAFTVMTAPGSYSKISVPARYSGSIEVNP